MKNAGERVTLATSRLRNLDPRRWSKALRALVVLVPSTVGSSVLAAPWVQSRWESHRFEQRFIDMDLPRVPSDLSRHYPAARVRVTADSIDLDLRPRTAAMLEGARDRAGTSVDALRRDARRVESRGLVRLRSGRLRDEDERRRARQTLAARWHMAYAALLAADIEVRDDPNLTPVVYVERSVPMVTLSDVWSALSNNLALALRGPHGITVLPLAHRRCSPVPSVEVDVTAARLLVRATPDRGGCSGNSRERPPVETVIVRTGADRGIRRLREVLAAGPWVFDAEPPRLLQDGVDLWDRGPWGEIGIRVAGDLPFGDFVEVMMGARERSPGSCHADERAAGCLFPHLTLAMLERDGLPTFHVSGE